MSRITAWTLHAAVVVMAATGIYLAWIVYFAADPAESELEMFAVQDPWQPWLVAVHVVAAPVLIFITGLIWFTHVWGRVKLGFEDRRTGGLVLAWSLAPLVGCGYLLQVVEAEATVLVLGWVHAAVGVVFAATYLVHVWRSGDRSTTADDGG